MITETKKNLEQLFQLLDESMNNDKFSALFKDGVKHSKNLILICLMEECLSANIIDEISI